MKLIKHNHTIWNSIYIITYKTKIDRINILQKMLYSTKTMDNKNEQDVQRINKLGIQMLLQPIYKHLFRHCETQITDDAYKQSMQHLKEHNLWGKAEHPLPNFDLELPPLQGNTVVDHFNIIGEAQCSKYKALLQNLLNKKFPAKPSSFVFASGWTKYFPDGTYIAVPYPDCQAMVFDTEVCVTEGNSPTLACAASTEYWYSWCSDRLVSKDKDFDATSTNDLIPFGKMSNEDGRLVVGHNVSYDRKFIQEQYFLSDDGTKFLDTMSFHIATSGLLEGQRALLLKNKSSSVKIWAPWMKVGSQNSLAAVYKLYCKEELSKDVRDIFVTGSMEDIRENFQMLVAYCCKDVQVTHEVLCEILPIFFERFPHPVTFSGMLSMGQMYLPVSGDWQKYIDNSEEEFNVNIEKLTIQLRKHAISAVDLLKDDKYKKDIWLWSLDWIMPSQRVKVLKEYPTWYRKLCQLQGLNSNNEPEKMSLSLRVTPLLLRLTWHGYPLHYNDTYGWGFLKPTDHKLHKTDLTEDFPYDEFIEYCNKNGKPDLLNEEGLDIGIKNVEYYKLPHKDGQSLRVGNPLAGNFLQSLEDGPLSGADKNIVKVLIKATKMAQYWKANKGRVMSQKVIWWNKDETPLDVKNSELYNEKEKYGAILPQVITSGTVTRRTVEKTWMTAANANISRVGSELKAMIRPPPGYYIVGADVDSEELWIASLLGDANFTKIHGGTPIGWMTIQGNKAEGTDMHSRTAKLSHITRSEAKIINYARIYGAGVYFMKHLFQQFNTGLSDKEANRQAFNLYGATRGEKAWYLTPWGRDLALEHNFDIVDKPFSQSKIKILMKRLRNSGYNVDRGDLITGAQLWYGGSESHMFNALEKIANSERPCTPFLNAAISRALELQYVDDAYMTSRVNWVVQSSAVDYLHLMLVSVNWLFSEYGIKGKLMITIHDEVQYLVAEEDRYRAALALHISNLLTRVFFSMKLGMNDLPQSVAFFSSVDVDRALRKDPKDDCVTPSNKLGLEKGFSIPPGESLTIMDAVQKTNGSLKKS